MYHPPFLTWVSTGPPWAGQGCGRERVKDPVRVEHTWRDETRLHRR